MVNVKILDRKQKKEISYYIEPRLKSNLDNKVIKSLQKKDKDCVLAIDGKEGSGKSTLALQLGKYVDPTLDLSRVVFDAESFRQAIFKAKKGQCVIFDEAFWEISLKQDTNYKDLGIQQNGYIPNLQLSAGVAQG